LSTLFLLYYQLHSICFLRYFDAKRKFILQNRVRDAEAAVKAVVTQHELTQAQFDAAVSFAYNSSRQNTRDALGPANTGDMIAVAEKMMLNVMITPRDRTGRKIGPAKRSRGLTSRRQRESAPFRQSAQ
jgi:lysozyme